MQAVVSQQGAAERMQALDLTPEKVAAATAPIPVHDYGLMSRSESGEIEDAKEENKIITFAVPFGGMMLMFMMVMFVAPSMLNNVLEEKIQKISEFLVSSVTPFQLMMGKLLGAIGVGLTLTTIYLGAAYGLAWHFEIVDQIPISIFVWFVFFLLLALIIFGSVFSAIGAACSEIRDARHVVHHYSHDVPGARSGVALQYLCAGHFPVSAGNSYADVSEDRDSSRTGNLGDHSGLDTGALVCRRMCLGGRTNLADRNPVSGTGTHSGETVHVDLQSAVAGEVRPERGCSVS